MTRQPVKSARSRKATTPTTLTAVPTKATAAKVPTTLARVGELETQLAEAQTQLAEVRWCFAELMFQMRRAAAEQMMAKLSDPAVKQQLQNALMAQLNGQKLG